MIGGQELIVGERTLMEKRPQLIGGERLEWLGGRDQQIWCPKLAVGKDQRRFAAVRP